MIVKPAPAEAQRAADLAATATSSTPAPEADSPASAAAAAGTAGGATTTPPAPAPSRKPAATRYVGSAPISAERYSADFAKIATEVLTNLAASGAKLTISLSIDAIHPDGFTEQQLRTLRENATTLKRPTNEFEAE